MLWPPFLPLVLAAVACALVPNRLGALIVPIASLSTLIAICQLPDGNLISYAFLSYELQPLQVDTLSRIFGIIAVLRLKIIFPRRSSFRARGLLSGLLLFLRPWLSGIRLFSYRTFRD